MPASASDDPISLKNPRRDTASTSSEAPFGNSRCIISRKSALPASSSRLRQNSGPFFFSISERTCTRSSLSFLPGQTGSMCLFLFSSLIKFRAVPSGLAPIFSGIPALPCRAFTFRPFGAASQPLLPVYPAQTLVIQAKSQELTAKSSPLTTRSSQLKAALPMTRRTTRNIHRAAQVVLVGQILTEFHLVGIAFPIHLNRQSCRRLLVARIKDLLTRR